MQRVSSTDNVIEAVLATQKATMVCNGLARSSIAGEELAWIKLTANLKFYSLLGMNEVTMDLLKPGEDAPRYTIHILDQPPARGNGKYAAFIVPQGR